MRPLAEQPEFVDQDEGALLAADRLICRPRMTFRKAFVTRWCDLPRVRLDVQQFDEVQIARTMSAAGPNELSAISFVGARMYSSFV